MSTRSSDERRTRPLLCKRYSRSDKLTRREAIRILSAGAGVGAFAAVAAQNNAAIAQAPASRTAFPKGAIVRTILDDLSPERLTGATLIHEHLSLGKSEWGSDRPTLKFYDDVALIADEVKACAKDGVSCIVDAGGQGLGRKINALRTIAEQSGVFIVACGGLHLKADYPPDTLRKTADQIADDLSVLAKSERWGAIGEMGTGPTIPMDDEERKGLLAAAKLHIRTGLPIITHTSDGCARCALDQVDLFESAGVNLHQVVIGHLNDINNDPAAAPIAIAKRGAYVAFDHSGKPDDPRADEYVRTIRAVLEAGHEDRICLSSDFSSEKYLRKNGGPGIDMVMTTFVPRLRRAGVNEATLRKILVENPRRALAFVPKTK
jgi:phosphotriesterase-related protein